MFVAVASLCFVFQRLALNQAVWASTLTSFSFLSDFQFVKFSFVLADLFSLDAWPWWLSQLVLTAQSFSYFLQTNGCCCCRKCNIHLCARGYFPGKTYQTPRASCHLSLIWCSLWGRMFGTVDICLVFNKTSCSWHVSPQIRLCLKSSTGLKILSFLIGQFVSTHHAEHHIIRRHRLKSHKWWNDEIVIQTWWKKQVGFI